MLQPYSHSPHAVQHAAAASAHAQPCCCSGGDTSPSGVEQTPTLVTSCSSQGALGSTLDAPGAIGVRQLSHFVTSSASQSVTEWQGQSAQPARHQGSWHLRGTAGGHLWTIGEQQDQQGSYLTSRGHLCRSRHWPSAVQQQRRSVSAHAHERAHVPGQEQRHGSSHGQSQHQHWQEGTKGQHRHTTSATKGEYMDGPWMEGIAAVL